MDLVGAIQNLYDNGYKPVLGNRDFAHDKNVVRRSVEQVFLKLSGTRSDQRL